MSEAPQSISRKYIGKQFRATFHMKAGGGISYVPKMKKGNFLHGDQVKNSYRTAWVLPEGPRVDIKSTFFQNYLNLLRGKKFNQDSQWKKNENQKMSGLKRPIFGAIPSR